MLSFLGKHCGPENQEKHILALKGKKNIYLTLKSVRGRPFKFWGGGGGGGGNIALPKEKKF